MCSACACAPVRSGRGCRGGQTRRAAAAASERREAAARACAAARATLFCIISIRSSRSRQAARAAAPARSNRPRRVRAPAAAAAGASECATSMFADATFLCSAELRIFMTRAFAAQLAYYSRRSWQRNRWRSPSTSFLYPSPSTTLFVHLSHIAVAPRSCSRVQALAFTPPLPC